MERGAGAGQILSGDDDTHAPEGGVREIDVDVRVGELARQLAQGPGPVLDIDHQDVAFVGDPDSGALKRLPASGHGFVVQQHMGDAPALTGERGQAADVSAHFARDLPQPGQLSGPVLEDHGHIRRHRSLILPPCLAPAQSGSPSPPVAEAFPDALNPGGQGGQRRGRGGLGILPSVEEIILRTIVVQFDGRVVEVFGASSGEAVRGHVALMREPKIGKPDYRGRSEIVLGCRFGVDADELPKLLPLLDKITSAVRAAQGERRPR